MFTFMFGVLGSLAFWIVYCAMSLFMAALIMKKWGNKSRAYVVISTRKNPIMIGTPNKYYWAPTGREATTFEYVRAMSMFIANFILWPIIIVLWVTKYFLYAVIHTFIFIMEKLFAITPEISIDIKGKGGK